MFFTLPACADIGQKESVENKTVFYEVKLSDVMDGTNYSHSGNVGELWIYFDTSEGSDKYDTTIIRMDSLEEGDTAISLIRAYLYTDDCSSSLFSEVQFSEVAYKNHFLPQVFSVIGDACVKLEYFGWKSILEGRNWQPDEGVKLMDRFQIRVKND